VLRAIALLMFVSMLFTIVPEGLAAGWAGELAGGSVHSLGWMQGLIMMAAPIGYMCGGLLINRLVRPSVRQRLVRPFAVLAPLALVGAVFAPPVYLVALISALTGFASGALVPAANGLFVQALPVAFRARAFGVMASGIQLLQGAGVLITGALAERFGVPRVVGLWGMGGVAVMLLVVSLWPGAETISASVARARAANAEADATAVQDDDTVVIPAMRNGGRPVGAHRAKSPTARTIF
jgi:MFS family permease